MLWCKEGRILQRLEGSYIPLIMNADKRAKDVDFESRNMTRSYRLLENGYRVSLFLISSGLLLFSACNEFLSLNT
jgi:hypothetical protein